MNHSIILLVVLFSAISAAAAIRPDPVAARLLAASSSQRAAIWPHKPVEAESVAEKLISEARRLSDRGMIPQASHALDISTEAFERVPLPRLRASWNRAQATIHMRQGQLAAARQAIEEALNVSRKAQDPAGEGAARTLMAQWFLDSDDPAAALQEALLAVGLAQGCGAREVEVESQSCLAEIYRELDRNDESQAAYTRSLMLAEDLRDSIQCANARNGLATLAIRSEEMDRAESLLHNALETYTKEDDLRGQGMASGNLAVVLEMTGRLADALAMQLSTLALKRQIRDGAGETMTLLNIGVVYNQAGLPHEALRWFKESERMAAVRHDSIGRAKALHNGGAAHYASLNFDAALSALDESLELELSASNRIGALQTRGLIAGLYHDAGFPEVATNEFASMIADFRELKAPRDEAITWNNLGTALASIGSKAPASDQQAHFQQARHAFEQSIAVRSPLKDLVGLASTYNTVGGLELLSGNLDAAERAFHQAIEFAEQAELPLEKSRAEAGLGTVARKHGQPQAALRHFDQSLKALADATDTEAAVEAHLGRAQTHYDLRRWSDCVRACENAIAIIEGARMRVTEPTLRAGLLSRLTSPYEELARCRVASDEPLKAWQAMERCKARTLAEIQRGGAANWGRYLTQAERRKLGELERAEALASADLRASTEPHFKQAAIDARLRTESFRRELTKRHREIARQAQAFVPPDMARLTHFMRRARLALVEFTLTDDSLLIALLTDDGKQTPAVRTFKVPVTRLKLESLVASFHGRLAHEFPEESNVEAELGLFLFPPELRAALDGKDSLCLIPDGCLWELPFATLKINGRYLVEDHLLSTSPSVAVWLEHAARPVPEPNAGRVVVIAAPSNVPKTSRLGRHEQSLDDLPGAARQAEVLSKFFGKRVTTLTNRDATETRAHALKGDYAVVHIATHAVFDPIDPLGSAILLGSDTRNDGQWTAREIYETSLFRADLVVLSACNTGRGRLTTGEGVLGLTWALVSSGSQTCLASHWSVADESTAELMIQYHKGRASSLRPAAALRAAQLRMLQSSTMKYRHPFHWGGWLLVE